MSIGGRPLCNLRLADDIDLLRSSEEELQQLTQRLEETVAEYGMEISSDKSKILVNSPKPRPSTNILMNGQTLKYLGSTQTKDGTSAREVKIRLVQAHSSMTRLAILWKNKAISFPTKNILHRSLVLSECRCFFMDVRAGCWRLIWKGGSRPLKTNGTEGCLAYHAESIERITVWQQVSILLLTVTSYNGSTMSIAMICFRRSYYTAP